MQSKYQLLEHERERECKQVKTLSSRNAVLEKNMEEAREKLAEVSLGVTLTNKKRSGVV